MSTSSCTPAPHLHSCTPIQLQVPTCVLLGGRNEMLHGGGSKQGHQAATQGASVAGRLLRRQAGRGRGRGSKSSWPSVGWQLVTDTQCVPNSESSGQCCMHSRTLVAAAALITDRRLLRPEAGTHLCPAVDELDKIMGHVQPAGEAEQAGKGRQAGRAGREGEGRQAGTASG